MWGERCGVATGTNVWPIYIRTRAALSIYRFPNNNICQLRGFWKMNDEIEVAASSKLNWKNPKWSAADHNLGMNYRHSHQVTYNVNTDLTGSLSAGINLINNGNDAISPCILNNDRSSNRFVSVFKFRLTVETQVQNFWKNKMIGFSVLF